MKKFIRENIHLLILGLVVTMIHGLTNGQYGFHRDELDIILNARQLDWGYVAYPPFTPWIASLGLALFGNSLQGLRLFSALGQGICVVLVGLIARDLGGSRSAQIMAAIAAAVAPVALTAGTMIQYMSFDYLWWVAIAFCFVRLLASENPRWWLGVGIAIGMGMMTKYTVVFFVAGLVAATLLTGYRRYLRSPWLWAGAGLAVLIWLPNLLWQIRHDFISLEFLSAIHARDIEWGRTQGFLPEQLYIAANPLTLPLWLLGLYLILFTRRMRRFFVLGVAFLITFILLWASQGRSYYVGPAYTLLLAAGAVGLEGWIRQLRAPWQKLGQSLAWGLLGLAAVLGVALVKPIPPIQSAWWDVLASVNGEVVEMVGWQDLTAQVADIYAGLPSEEKARTAILAGNYGEAGALDLYGRDYGLPLVISGSNSLWARGYGSIDPETIIVVGFEAAYASYFFKECDYAGRVTNQYNVSNEETSDHTGLYVCRQPRNPWAEMWPQMQWFQ